MGVLHYYHNHLSLTTPSVTLLCSFHQILKRQNLKPVNRGHGQWPRPRTRMPPLTTCRSRVSPISASATPLPQQPLDLTEDNIRQVLAEARVELSQLFDDSVGITGVCDPLYIFLSLAQKRKKIFALVDFGCVFACIYIYWWWFLRFSGQAELAELDGPFVKISLRGRFWHRRSTVVARLGNYLKQRIPVSLFFVFFQILFFVYRNVLRFWW